MNLDKQISTDKSPSELTSYFGFFGVNVSSLELERSERVRRERFRVVLDFPNHVGVVVVLAEASIVCIVRIAEQRSMNTGHRRVAVHEPLVLL